LCWEAVLSSACGARAAEASRWRHVQHIEDTERVVVDVDLIRKRDRMGVAEFAVVGEAGGRISFWRHYGPDAPWGVPSGPELPDAELPAYGAGTVRAVTADAVGTRVAVATEHAVTVWNAEAGEATAQFRIHDGRPRTVDLNPGGTLLAARTGRHAVTVWQVASADEALTLRGTVSDVTTVALGAGPAVAVGSAKGEAEVWGVSRQQLRFRAPVHPDAINCVALSANSELLVTGAADGDVKVWDVAGGTLVAEFNTGQGAVTGLAIGKWRRRVVTAAASGAVQRWDIAAATEIRRDAPAGSGARTIVLSPHGLSYAAVGDGYSLYHARSGKRRRAPGGKRPVAGVQLSQIGGRALAEYDNGDAQVFDVATGKAVYTHVLARRPWEINFYHSCVPRNLWFPHRRPSPARLFPNGRTVLQAGQAGSGPRFRDVWDEGPPSLVELEGDRGTIAFPQDPPSAAPCVLSPDHSLLVTGSKDGRLHLWDVVTRTYLRSFRGRHGGRNMGYLDASVDRANRWLAAIGPAGAYVWDLRTGERRDLPHAWHSGGASVRVSPNGRYLMLWVAARPDLSEPASVRLWDLTNDEEASAPPITGAVGATWGAAPADLHVLTEQSGRASVVVWSPGEPAAQTVVGFETSIPARRPSAMSPYARPDGPQRIAVSYDGSTMAFTTSDGNIEVWRQAASNNAAPQHRRP